jgi:hypothetical protein
MSSVRGWMSLRLWCRAFGHGSGKYVRIQRRKYLKRVAVDDAHICQRGLGDAMQQVADTRGVDVDGENPDAGLGSSHGGRGLSGAEADLADHLRPE